MSSRTRLAVSLVFGFVVVTLLVALTIGSPPTGDTLLPATLFFVLIVFTTTFGVPLAGGRGSLLPMTTVAAFLVLGPVPTAWVAFIGALVHGLVRYLWSEQLRERLEPGILSSVGLAAANATIQVLSILAGGLVYSWAGGDIPLTEINGSTLLPVVLFALTYLAVNLLIVGLYFAARGREPLKLYLRSVSGVVMYEGWPMVFSPLMALVYVQLGLIQFALMSLAIISASLVARGLSLSSQRLERRVRELDSLQAVGQALSTSLDLESILPAIHTQVASLMPAQNFYVALYDAGADEVSFPLAIEHGEQVRWRSRQTGNGLTEYILRTRTPLLIQGGYDATVEGLGLEKFGKSAAYWLGVPLLAGDEPLGVITIQSYSLDQAYDLSHQEVLTTIATQASVAIQNARLYARTDESLALRVDELVSILRTTQEGVLLFDLDYRILAANRAVADLLSTAQLDLLGKDLYVKELEAEPPLAELIGYGPGVLPKECQTLSLQGDGFNRQEIVLPGPPERCVERTLTPVRKRQGEITGWLLVFRDVTEEHELAALRDDLMDMLIHDLRSPLTVMTSSLELMKADLDMGKGDALGELVQLAEKSGNRLLRLINDLLDISRLESGNVTIHPRAVEIVYLIDSVVTRLSPLATQARIEVDISCEPDLPPVYVDPELMDRVLHNLLDNALKFTPDGGHIELWARADSDGGSGSILAGVTDTGPGIPQEAQARLFKKFQQVVSAVGRRLGTGLGLPYCKLAVEAHGGEIWAESEVGQGSTFVMRLPTATSPDS